MKLTFVSNYLNHHQTPFSDAMYALLNGEYRFVATQRMGKARQRFGWEEKQSRYLVKAYQSENVYRAQLLVGDSDVVILGSAPDKYFIDRLKRGKLTFRYSERLYKQGLNIRKLPRAMVSAWLHHGRFQKYPLYMLCASAYTAADCALFGNYRNRTYKWGYFTEVKQYAMDTLFGCKQAKERISILWAGRLIDWKHPEAAVVVAERLKSEGYNFEMNFIGDGALGEKLNRMIREKELEDCVHMLGVMTPEDVRKHMEASDIYLFTSDFSEGWGAVLNESMNSGCAVVASHAIGSVPFLIKHEENGLIYRNGDMNGLYSAVKRLMDSEKLRRYLGENAYRTMTELWNAEVAAKRLLILIEELNESGQCDLFEDGPCSRAEKLKNDWF